MNYGMAGLILFVFYRLISNELAQLRNALEKLDDEIDNLSRKIERLITVLDDIREDDKR
jgi:predicted  nucleic acid-binding Zn-ribbon protein